ncbi:ATP-binding protein [Rhodovulum sulfidophilum]|uniref:ATP-binding protein n=1 Tax=Rhodovulum sulfidophilum TaxID=35806 RepID=UPI001EE43842|nr:ATP-binding protein [Rhodovulum sulfidophilum]
MPHFMPVLLSVRRSAAAFADRAWVALALGILLAVAAWTSPWPWLFAPLLTAGVTLGCLAALLRILGRPVSDIPSDRLRRLCACTPGATLVTDAEGRVLIASPEAQRRVAAMRGQPVSDALQALFADPRRAVGDLIAAAARGLPASARRSLASGPLQVGVERAGSGLFLWRFDSSATDGPEIALPMVRLDPAGRLSVINAAARALVGQSHETVAALLAGASDETEEVVVETPEGPSRRRLLQLCMADGGREFYILPQGPASRVAEAPEGFLDALPVALLQLDTDGTVRLSNARAVRLLGGEPGEALNLCDRLEGLGRPVSDWLADAAQGRAPNTAEVLRVARDDREVFVQVALARMAEGALVAVLHDVTEMKTLEAQFTQSQKMQAIGQLAGGVAHDFNNLLTAISGHCDLLMLRHDAGDPDYGDLVQIHQNANRAASLVGQLLAFSRKQTLSPEVLDLRDTMGELAHLLDRLVGEKVQLRMRHAEALPPIRADKRQLEQVVMNLVVNARDAMPEGGEIRIETEAVQLSTELQRDRAVVPPGPYAMIRVRDEGQGIPPDRLSKIFEPFYTSKRPGEGTGLGLSTVYGIVKQTGGFVFVDSTVGQGSCFSVYLPTHSGRVGPVAPLQESGAVEDMPGSAVVLLVEDEAPVRSFAARAMRMRGHTVLEAESGEEALETLADPELKVDVFVTDVVMPGLDGPGWVSKALAARPGTRVIFVSGYAEDSFGEIKARIPNSVYLPKPFSLADLTATVQRQLRAAAEPGDTEGQRDKGKLPEQVP